MDEVKKLKVLLAITELSEAKLRKKNESLIEMVMFYQNRVAELELEMGKFEDE